MKWLSSPKTVLDQLQIKTRLSTLFRRALEYFGHIARKTPDSLLERLFETGKIEGKRSRGRTSTRWLDQIRTTLEIPFHEALHATNDQRRWRFRWLEFTSSHLLLNDHWSQLIEAGWCYLEVTDHYSVTNNSSRNE
ncbi:uncharacterized protein LOC114240183 [Bombyx mandarina]|uniref:Uncharacterized protein LOC114240183 n=1 Tax=Bombyx mandarina TaxID=7092 RepID=A0A6J2JD53_BOMMA|nr:uncharacterized protein LOC114240183 [Bombyx mandarina]XP_028026456.1 uncharacterized protein LOC114240183 [Bombyx mandarina]